MIDFILLYILSVVGAGLYAVTLCDRKAPNNIAAVFTFLAFIPYVNSLIAFICITCMVIGGILCINEGD